MGGFIYLAGLVFAQALRLPYLMRRPAERHARQTLTGAARWSEWLVLLAMLGGIWVFPLLYILIGWPAIPDYHLPTWSLIPAALIFMSSLVIRWQAHHALGKQWSHTVETMPEHALVTSGIYRYLRHPIYVSLVLWAAAQPALLPNWLAGWGGAVAVALIWLVRVPREERMMLERFGPAYQHYLSQTGRLLPRRVAQPVEAPKHDRSV